MARKLRVMMEGRTLINDDGTINELAFLRLMNAMRPAGEPEMTLEECRAVLAETDDETDDETAEHEGTPPSSEP